MPSSPKSRRQASRSRSRSSSERGRKKPYEQKRDTKRNSKSPSVHRKRQTDKTSRPNERKLHPGSPRNERRSERYRDRGGEKDERHSSPNDKAHLQTEQNFGKPVPAANDPNKVKPNFGLSGKLLEDTNTVNGVVITYAQPAEARKPKVRWRLYPFKGDETLPTMFIHRQSAYLLGRDRRIVDIPIDHPSCSKQHAVIQYRMVPTEKEDGTIVRRVRPYIIDLGSANGTYVNKKRIESQKYVELLEKDVLTFGFSSREYVMLHEGSKDDEYKSGAESDSASE